MKRSLWGNIYRSFGLHIRANRADARSEEGRLLVAEHRKPENRRPRKVSYEEIMSDLATGTPGRFLDRKVQAYISGDQWPPMSMTETFDKVEADGMDNACSTSIQGVEKLIMLAHPDVYGSIRLDFAPHRATFTVGGSEYRVQGKSAAMALMGVRLATDRLRHGKDEAPDLGKFVTTVTESARHDR
ncbi:hypothetical protein GR250_04210 [Rhizobium leguminosarum]|nr:hypothetical protein [Rhizobium leguminosarum]